MAVRTQPQTIEVPEGTEPDLARQLDNIQENFDAIFQDAGLVEDALDAHADQHESGGSDEINVDGLPGLLADGQTPLAHATSHQSGGSDAIKLDDLATPDDNTDLDATSGRHGLLPKLSGVATEYLTGAGTWVTPSVNADTDRVVGTGETRTIADTYSVAAADYFAVEGTGVLVIEGDGALWIG